MITVIDYGSGNLRSVAKALESVGGNAVVSSRVEDVQKADRVVLPGVGAFADCRRNLEESGLMQAALDHVSDGKPFLGICVGMQLLFTQGHEFGLHPGLDLIPGHVVGFETDMVDPADDRRHLKVPHMGWNRVRQVREHALWAGIPDASHFYFVHSFYPRPDDPEEAEVGAADYGIRFTTAVARDNIFATQFHPEKSQKYGLKLLENFLAWSP